MSLNYTITNFLCNGGNEFTVFISLDQQIEPLVKLLIIESFQVSGEFGFIGWFLHGEIRITGSYKMSSGE